MHKLIVASFLLLLLAACDKNRILDENKEIPEYQWFYKDRVGLDVMVEDTSCFYNLYINLRMKSDYKYNNIFVMLYTQLPDKKELKQRYEIPLQNERGKWLGKGLGDIYDYQHLIVGRANLSQKGIYRFNIEQNMRDDTLSSVVAAGIRVERGDPKD